jgi:hypothetical protein
MSTKNLIPHGSGISAVDLLKLSSTKRQACMCILKHHVDFLGAVFQKLMESPDNLPDPRQKPIPSNYHNH